MKTRTHLLAMDFLLLLVTFFWGTTFILVKNAVALVDVYGFLFVRMVAAFILMAALFGRKIVPFHRPTIFGGMVLGAALFGAFATQTIGLTMTSATNGALITGLNVVMVPILSFLLLRKAPAPMATLGVVLATFGLYYLTGGAPSQWNRGDYFIVACALFIAAHILLTGYYAPKWDTAALATWQVGFVTLFSFIGGLWSGGLTLILPASVWIAVGITSVFATVFAFSIQTYAQKYTTPTRAALIFTGEPVFGALIAHLYGGEPLLKAHLIGGGLIFLGMILSEIRPDRWIRNNGSSGAANPSDEPA